jgi:hypothetical protein
MWPYDYFNQFSNIEINNEIGPLKKIFLAIWYADDDPVNKKLQEKKIETFKKVVGDLNKSLRIEDSVFEPVIAKEIGTGDINESIQDAIIKSLFVVCDVTPIGEYAIGSKGNKSVFNPNVMVELGLALAWKMEEQVIVLWDENDKRFPGDLANDIHDYRVDRIDAKYEKLNDLFVTRYEKFKFKRELLVKNLKNKIDADSLELLAINNYSHGLLFNEFVDKKSSLFHQSIARIRHLLNLGALRAMHFPNTFDNAYCWTVIGRMVLEDFGVKLYPSILVDIDFITHYYDTPEFSEKTKQFEKRYDNLQWEWLVKEIVSYVDNDVKQSIIKESTEKEPKVDDIKDKNILYAYLRKFDYDYVCKNLIKKIQESNKAYSRFFMDRKIS